MDSKAPGEQILVARLEKLYTAVVSDMLDDIGLRSQVMAPRIRPLFPDFRLVGTAATVQTEEAEGVPDVHDDRYKLHLEAIDALKPGEVMVTSRVDTCFWGELMSIAAQNLGSAGIVIDGYTRDIAGIKAVDFPVFCAGVHAADALGRSSVLAYGVPIVSAGVKVKSGDLVLGDFDGVVVIPSEVADDVITRAEEKGRGEDVVRDAIQGGMGVTEAFLTYGIM